MDVRTLAYFVATAETGTASAAAEQMHITQPALSRQLQALERDLGITLFDRTPRRLTLSPAGRALLPRAKALLEHAEGLRRAARVLAAGGLEQVTIAAPSSSLTDIVSPFLATLAPEDPTPSVRETSGATAHEALQEGVDLVITAGQPPAPLAVRALPTFTIWAYLPAEHPLAERGRASGTGAVALADLAAERLVVLPPSHHARRVLEGALATAGLVAPRMLEASNGTVAQALCAAGRGAAVVTDDPRFGLSRLAVSTSELTVGVAAQRADLLQAHLSCAWDPDHPGAAVLEALADRIREFVVERYGADR